MLYWVGQKFIRVFPYEVTENLNKLFGLYCIALHYIKCICET